MPIRSKKSNREETIMLQTKELCENIAPKLRPGEDFAFLIRPSVSHGDIEVYLNGRLFYTTTEHMQRVKEAKALDDYVDNQVLPRLRGHKFHFSEQKAEFTLLHVQKEINFILVSLCNEILSIKEQEELDEAIESSVRSVFKLERSPSEYTCPQLQHINGLIYQELVKIIAKLRKHA